MEQKLYNMGEIAVITETLASYYANKHLFYGASRGIFKRRYAKRTLESINMIREYVPEDCMFSTRMDDINFTEEACKKVLAGKK